MALSALRAFGGGATLTAKIARLETELPGHGKGSLSTVLEQEAVTETALASAQTVKAAVGQINVLIHAIGILVSLPYLLEEDEVVESLSLGAGNTGRAHDLETTRQIAEFKFIEWKGGAESIRQNGLFVDLFNLASANTSKRRVMYVIGREHPERFLRNRRAIESVLSKNKSVATRFAALHGDTYRTVDQYYATISHTVELVDLKEVVPAFANHG
jgi:hypothetical protein